MRRKKMIEMKKKRKREKKERREKEESEGKDNIFLSRFFGGSIIKSC